MLDVEGSEFSVLGLGCSRQDGIRQSHTVGPAAVPPVQDGSLGDLGAHRDDPEERDQILPDREFGISFHSGVQLRHDNRGVDYAGLVGVDESNGRAVNALCRN